MSHLTETAARELGNSLRFMRHGRNMTVRDVAKRAELSAAYVQNLEKGERPSASEDAFYKLAAGYGVDQQVIADLLLKAQVMSALERHGLPPEQRAFVWSGVRNQLSELDIHYTDVARVVAEMMLR